MSYTIVYARQFLRLPDSRIIPLCLAGCSNLTRMNNGHERRVRRWEIFGIPYFNQGEFAVSEERLLELYSKMTGGRYQEHFRWAGKREYVDDAGLMRFVKRGIKEALTLEELAQRCGCPISLFAGFESYIRTGRTDRDSERRGEHRVEPFGYLSTSEDLSRFLEIAAERAASRGPEDICFVRLEFPCENLFPKVERKTLRKKADDTYLLKEPGGLYLNRLTAHRVSYTNSVLRAKQFATATQAAQWERRYRVSERSGRQLTSIYIPPKQPAQERLSEI